MKFVGRARELKALREELASPRPSLVIVYGRRRVGKSRLILEAVRATPHIYFQAARLTDHLNLLHLKEAVKAYMRHEDPVLDSIAHWDGLLAFVRQLASQGRQPLTLVLDEFPYLCEGPSSYLPSVIQRFWDETQRMGAALNVVLCGSAVSFMEGLLAERNPLYGRHTRKFRVDPLGLRDVAEYFEGWSAEDILRAYAVFGGIPYYFTRCDPARDLRTNLREVVLTDGSPLREEPEHVLQEELRDIKRYAAVMQAVASGATKMGDIVSRIPDLNSATDVSYYLSTLQKLHLIRREVSLDRRDRQREKNARYYLEDHFMAFWYHFVLPNLSALQAGYADEVYDQVIAPGLEAYMGQAFERICRECLHRYGPDLIGEPVQEVGKIWGPDFDIDAAGQTLRRVPFFGECKWSGRPVGRSVLQELRDAAGKTAYGRGLAERYELLFSRSGFTPELQALARSDSRLVLIGLERLLGVHDG